MTPHGPRPRNLFPHTYKGYTLLRSHGRVYGYPPWMEPVDEIPVGQRPPTHPAVVNAATLEELKDRIDQVLGDPVRPESVGHCDGYELIRFRGALYAVPESAGPVDLDEERDRRRAGVLKGGTADELRERIRGLREAVPVEFAGWLPVYELWGNCGQHPQFKHTAEPPPGYRFTCSAPPKKWRSFWARFGLRLWKRTQRVAKALWVLVRPSVGFFQGGAGLAPRARLRVVAAMFRQYRLLRRTGAGLFAVLHFLRTRHFKSQVLLGDQRGLVFLTSMPYTFGQYRWLVEIEDPTTLFYPFVQNGQTSYQDLADSRYFPMVKALLEADECRGIVTHMRSTERMVDTLFASDTIRAKLSYAPLGVPLPARWQRHEDSEEIHLLFINSWCQLPGNFYVRGGLDVLEAFAILHERYPQLRLTLRTRLPDLDDHYHRILEAGWVRVVDRFMAADEMEDLLAGSHIFLLPAARVHIVSLLQAMSYGLAVVTSDGWGIDEYVTHERNGLVVKGRYGKVSWADEQAGMLREDYEPMYMPDPQVVEGIVEAVSRLVEDRSLRRRLGRTARMDVKETFNLERWNEGLQRALDKAYGVGSTVAEGGVETTAPGARRAVV